MYKRSYFNCLLYNLSVLTGNFQVQSVGWFILRILYLLKIILKNWGYINILNKKRKFIAGQLALKNAKGRCLAWNKRKLDNSLKSEEDIIGANTVNHPNINKNINIILY